jgi:GntR family histidine utilization transcriptional repressor
MRASKVQPRYQRIKEFIYRGIKDHTYPPDSQVPAEIELAKRFKVSRMTANRAIRELVNEGILVRHQGLGTFVASIQAESPLLEIRNIADEVRARQHVYSNELCLLVKERATAEVAAHLGVANGSGVFHSLILHKENGVPIQIEDRYVDAATVPGYLEQDFSRMTPNQYLSELFPLSDIEHIVEAVLPDQESRQLLEIDRGEPCLQVNRRTWSEGRLISYARLIHPGSRYRLSSRSQST